MKNACFAVLAALLTSANASGGDPTDVKSILKPICTQHKAPAALAALIRDGEIEALGVYGVRELGGAAAEIGDLSMIGSCGKAVTRLLIARLVQQGKLRFDATLAELLPDVEMRDEYRPVTLAQVIAFRGGLQPYTEIGPIRTAHLFNLQGSPREQRAAFVAHLLKEEPAAKPGTKEVYSNAGYGLLGHIAERVADTPYEELVRREVFEPLGMRDSRVGQPGSEPVRAHLVGHLRQVDGYAVARPMPGLAPIAPAGGMSCTISDFARLADALVRVEAGTSQPFLKPEIARGIRALRPGGGEPIEGVPFFGGDGLYTAAYAVWPSQKLGIVVATNAGENDAVCAATLEALRAKFAPQAAAVPQDGGPGGPPPGRTPLGIMLRATNPGDIEISEVKPDSLAAKAGVKGGDRLVAVNGVAVSDLPQGKLREALGADKLVLKLERDGTGLEITLTRLAEGK